MVSKLLIENQKWLFGNYSSKPRNNSLKIARGKPEIVTRKSEIVTQKLLVENQKLLLGNCYSKTRNNSLKVARGKPEFVTWKLLVENSNSLTVARGNQKLLLENWK